MKRCTKRPPARWRFVAATVALALGASFATDEAMALDRFIVTEPVHSVDSVPFYLAVREGFFEEVGLDVQIITSEGGGRHIAAVISGDADAFIGGPEHLAFSLVRGGPPMKAVVSMSNRANQYLVAAKDSAVAADTPLADALRGKRMAIGTRGGTGYSLAMYLLATNGLEPASDVTLLEVASSAGRLAAVKAGQADIAMLNEPLISQGIKQGIWDEPFFSIPEELGPFMYTTINVPQRLIDERPDLVDGMVQAMLKGLELSFTNPELMREVAEAEFPTLPAEDLGAILDRTLKDGLWQRDGTMPLEAWDMLHTVVREGGLLARDVVYDEIFDPQFLPAGQ